jgi:hypothetical protein
MSGMDLGLRSGAVVGIVGAIVALVVVPARPPAAPRGTNPGEMGIRGSEQPGAPAPVDDVEESP